LNEGRREYLYDPASSALVRIDSDPARRAVAGMIRDRKTTRLRARSALINAVASGRAMWAQPAVADVVTNEEDDNDLRVTAVNALRTLGDEDSIATLKNVTGSRERKVRDAATSAVQQLARSTPASLPPPDPAEPTPPPAPTTTEPVVAAPAPPPPEKPAPPAPAAVARPLPPPEIPANTKPDPAAARAALENAVQLESVRDWEGALREYRRARVLDPAMIGFIDASIARVQTQMGPDPAGKADGPEALRRARQYDALGRTAEAMLWYERAIQTLPESSADWKAAKDRLDALKAGR
jgi:tetratricopeptide (TPR) repeat protein